MTEDPRRYPPKDLQPPTLTEAALRVLAERYLRQHPEGRQETPTEMFWRVAYEAASAERKYAANEEQVLAIARKFYGLMASRKFLPNSPTLMNAGTGNGLQYAACYVLPISDSISGDWGIMGTAHRAAVIHQSGGGVGFSFSRLRPKDWRVQTTNGRSSGPISFLRHVYDSITEAVRQGGSRRGANMAMLRVDHPDIMEFIRSKLDGGITNFNISVAITDEFMGALESDKELPLRAQRGWPRQEGADRYQGGEVIGHLRARTIWNAICEAAWQTGDPGLFFIDRCNASAANPVPHLGPIESTNPCGEQPLYPWDACTLGSINLASFGYIDPKIGNRCLELGRLEEAIRTAVRFLDDLLDVNPYPFQEISETVKTIRRIGLGVMGWADLLFKLGFPYNSDEALNMAGKIMQLIQEAGHDESARLAEERGSFPLWTKSIYQSDRPRRNSTVTTIAPTGTISIIAGCSSGIEPVFALAFRHIVGERHLTFINPIFEGTARGRGFYSEELRQAVAAHGTLRDLGMVPEEVRHIFVTAHEIEPEWHVRMQAAFQEYTDNAVSKTVNLPHTATVADVEKAYRLAWETGCMGITVFRDGCKGTQVLHVGTRTKPKSPPEPAQSSTGTGIDENALIAMMKASPSVVEEAMRVLYGDGDRVTEPRPASLPGRVMKVETPMGSAFLTITEKDDEPFELFINGPGNEGSDIRAIVAGLAKMISDYLRLKGPVPRIRRVERIIRQLRGIGGRTIIGYGRDQVTSIPDAIARALETYLAEKRGETPGLTTAEAELPMGGMGTDICPDCKNLTLVFEEGCRTCHSCGYTQC